MRCASLFLAAASAAMAIAATGKLGDAAEITNNPAGAVYAAVLPNRDDTAVRGSVIASSVANGQAIEFQVTISGLPDEGGPFPYHIHDQPVPADGNCTKTLAHLDPYERGEDPVCDPEQPQTCQVGDSSGKHGKLTGPAFSKVYQDKYAALVPGIGAFFGNRSIVIHFANKTRITCANFEAVAPGYSGPGTAGIPASTPSLTTIPYNNATSTGFTTPGASTATPTADATTEGTSQPSSGAMRDVVFSGALAVAAFAAALL